MSGSCVVIGGGITGLAAAHALNAAVAAGFLDTATLLEAAPQLGGKIVTERMDGFVLEAGPDSFLTLKPEALELCRTLGLADQIVGTLAPRHVFVLSRGVLEPLPDGLAGLVPTRLLPFLRSGLFSVWEKARIAGEFVVSPPRNGAEESVGEFVRRRLGPAAVDRLAAPLLAGIYAGDVDRLSLQAAFPQLAEMESHYGSLMMATVLRHLRRRSRLPPGEYADGGDTDSLGMFATLGDGLDQLVSRIKDSLLHVGVRTSANTREITREGNQYRVHLANGASVDADVVIVTTPAYTAARLLRGLTAAAASALDQIPYASTAAIGLGFARADVAHPLAGHGYVVARGEGLAHTACTWASSKWPRRTPRNCVLLRCYVGRAGDRRALNEDDDSLVATVLAEVRPLLGITGRPLLARVHRWEDAMPQYEVGHLGRVDAITDTLSQTPGVLVAGAGYGGLGLPDCIRQGTEVAGAALRYLGAASG
ncbi:MAG TPA: protoporphyrinogen oxidase [bacterium]|nr:protoporphyrinogen oxidase [bacterium]